VTYKAQTWNLTVAQADCSDAFTGTWTGSGSVSQVVFSGFTCDASGRAWTAQISHPQTATETAHATSSGVQVNWEESSGIDTITSYGLALDTYGAGNLTWWTPRHGLKGGHTAPVKLSKTTAG
jgi:hypothetical protein